MSEEIKKHQHKLAEEEIDDLLLVNRPKNLVVGVSRGVGNVLGGAIGGVGILVLGPTTGLAAGLRNGGIIGGISGFLGGTVAGVVGSIAMILGGALSGVTQMVLGVTSIPGSISGPVTGKWWNDVEGTWVETNLAIQAEELKKVPEDDSDILGDASNEKPEILKESMRDNVVKDTHYYEVLGVDPKAEQSKIKRQYYLLARQYHPDKIGKDQELYEKFQSISEAYQVLSNPELRKQYDREGCDGLSADRTGIALDNQKIDASLLFAFLFGSDAFYEYIGRLATGTSALVGDANKLSLKDSRRLQKRRCLRIALHLTEKLASWIIGLDDHDSCIQEWKKEAIELSHNSYGYELVLLLGQAYSLSAAQFLGSLDSGIGMPSITKWAKGKAAEINKGSMKNKSAVESLKTGIDMVEIHKKAERDINKARTVEERKAIAESLTRDQLAMTLQIMWTVTAVDVTSTTHEACQMVLFNKAFDSVVRSKIGEGIATLGEVFLNCPEPKGRNEDPFELYEQATFAATLETIKRKEDDRFRASFRS